MKMLNRNRLSPWHASLLLALASLLLAIPCAAAAPMAFRISVGQQPSSESQEAKERREQKREDELKAQRLRVEQSVEQELKEQEVQARELKAKALKELELTEQAKAQQERSVQEQERTLKLEAEAREKAESELFLFRVAGNAKEMEEHRRMERQTLAKHQAELAREARVSMDQAIQLALNQHAGKVVECMLVKEMNEVMYRLIIVNETDPGIRVYVFLSGMDGRIVKTETEK